MLMSKVDFFKIISCRGVISVHIRIQLYGDFALGCNCSTFKDAEKTYSDSCWE